MKILLSDRNISISLAGCLLILIFSLLGPSERKLRQIDDEYKTSAEVIRDWYQHALLAERMTEGYMGPIVARMYAYIGVAAYEASLPELGPGHQSLAIFFPVLNGLSAHTGRELYLPAVLHGCYGYLFENFIEDPPQKVTNSHNLLTRKWDEYCKRNAGEDLFLESKELGERVASVVFDWSATDSLGHQANRRLHEHTYEPVKGLGKWEPCPNLGLPALLPYWGNVRPFIIHTKEYLSIPYPEYSTSPNSVFYSQALEILTINSPLSYENWWIAEFWSDDQPGLTFTPIGRWVSIANQAIEREKPDVGKILETYFKLGIALNDAMIACWYSKYYYNLERPKSYIGKVFDPEWKPIHHDPPFPAYPSGHATIGGAAAEILTSQFGDHFPITDYSHSARNEFKGKPRSYHSFHEMADESAFSRIPLGVHFRMDSEEGLRLGKSIGRRINQLPIKSDS